MRPVPENGPPIGSDASGPANERMTSASSLIMWIVLPPWKPSKTRKSPRTQKSAAVGTGNRIEPRKRSESGVTRNLEMRVFPGSRTKRYSPLDARATGRKNSSGPLPFLPWLWTNRPSDVKREICEFMASSTTNEAPIEATSATVPKASSSPIVNEYSRVPTRAGNARGSELTWATSRAGIGRAFARAWKSSQRRQRRFIGDLIKQSVVVGEVATTGRGVRHLRSPAVGLPRGQLTGPGSRILLFPRHPGSMV